MYYCLSVAAALLLIAPSLALTDASVYSWQNKDGTITFTDNPALAPKGAKVNVRSYASSSDDFSRAVTQREFAQRLAIELGLGDQLTAEQAAEALAGVGIAPPLGEWDLDESMTSALVERLRTLTVGAAVVGKIALDPDQAVFAFDSTAALVGIKIRGATAPEPAPLAETPVVTAPTPVYVVPTAEPLSERVIYVGGGIVDPFFQGASPTIIVDQRIVNIDNRVIVRKRARPQRRAPRTVHRAGIPPPPPKKPYAVRSQRATVGTHSGQRRYGSAPRVIATRKVVAPRQVAAGRTVMPSRRVGTRPLVRHLRPNPGHAIAGSRVGVPVMRSP
jgi:hypothetical protein